MGKTLGLLATALVLSFFVPATAESAVLKLDTGFGGDGRVTTGFGNQEAAGGRSLPRQDRINAIGVQPDGKLIAAGTSECAIDPCSQIALLRYGADGELDTGFGDEGKRSFVYGETGSFEDLVVLPDGGVQLVGRASQFIGSRDNLLLARFTGDGLLDDSFAGDGLVNVGITGERWRLGLLGAALLEDGDMVTSGWITCGRICHQWLIGRYQPDGSRSPEFEDGRLIRYRATGNIDAAKTGERLATSIAVDAEGRLIVAGPAGERRTQVIRMFPDGTIDDSFAGRGFINLSVTRKVGKSTLKLKRQPQGVAVSPDGSIYVAAGQEERDGNVGALFRLNEDGFRDRGFGGRAGHVTTQNLAVTDLAADRCGRIVVGGTWSRGGGSDFGVARYSARGKLDRSFGGTTKVRLGRGHDSHATSLQLFGRRLFIGGQTKTAPGDTDFGTVALNMPRSAFRCAR
ncbi:MAG TPA: delta-60 repeat domain-containing protein [Solirubrobacterales bacterium]|nr:delta-60 repeat domain-containing protein [Solirubrobacterales bacterium]